MPCVCARVQWCCASPLHRLNGWQQLVPRPFERHRGHAAPSQAAPQPAPATLQRERTGREGQSEPQAVRPMQGRLG